MFIQDRILTFAVLGNKQLQAKDLEIKLAEAKLEQQVQASAQMELKASQFSQQIEVMRETEKELRNQLDSYGEKFKEFQETLQMSNEVWIWPPRP